MPDPAPPPTTDEGIRYTGTVESVHWYGTPVFTSPTFEIVRYSDRITIGSVTLPILLQDERSLTARTSEMSFSVQDSHWLFNGVPGSGSGTWAKQ